METLDFTNIASSSTNNYIPDGERSPNRGPCPCGYKHWCNGKEYDFVFGMSTSSGPQHLGVNANDNIYKVAEEFVLKYEMNNLSLNNQHIINTIADRVTRHITQCTPLSIDNKSAPPPNNFNFEEISILTDQDLVDFQKRSELSKIEQEKVNQELEKIKKDKIDIKAQMENDRKEVLARRQISEAKQPSTIPNGYTSVVGDDGNVKLVPKTPSRNTGNFSSLRELQSEKKPSPAPTGIHFVSVSDPTENSDEEEDDDEIWERYHGYPPKEKWTVQMVISNLKQSGEENTIERMKQCGFSSKEIAPYIKHITSSHMHHVHHVTHVHQSPEPVSPDKAFVGIGHKLVTSTSSPTITTSLEEDYKIEVNPSLPQTAIRVRLYDGNQIIVKVNHNTTVDQLIMHVRSASHLAPGTRFILKNRGVNPPQVLSQESLTIKDANLISGNVVQALN